jgi:hypothetical protein
MWAAVGFGLAWAVLDFEPVPDRGGSPSSGHVAGTRERPPAVLAARS